MKKNSGLSDRPLGIFDSGLGGVVALRTLRALLPHRNFVYFGDSGRMPYGSRSETEIFEIARQNIDFMESKGVEAILVACGTICTVALPVLREKIDTPLFGVIEPTVKKAAELTKNGRIGVLSTPATKKGGAFYRGIKELDASFNVTQSSSELLAKMIEKGIDGAALERELESCTAIFLKDGIDTLVLGCTHYELLREKFESLMPELEIIDSGTCGAEATFEHIGSSDSCRDIDKKNGEIFLYTSGDVELFKKSTDRILGEDVENIGSVIL